MRFVKDMVLLFLHDLSVPFTNNEAEQGLRMPTVREKFGVLQNRKRLENYCVLRTVTETGRKHGRGALETLRAGPAAFMELLELALAPTSDLDLYLNVPGYPKPPGTKLDSREPARKINPEDQR